MPGPAARSSSPPPPFPPHAHIPGRTPRHAEGAFDTLRATARPGMNAGELANSAAFRTGLAWLQAGYFWEAHELFEPVWMALEPGSRERALVACLIQIANARLKRAMGRPRAARRIAELAAALLDEVGDSRCMGLTPAQIKRWVDALHRNGA